MKTCTSVLMAAWMIALLVCGSQCMAQAPLVNIQTVTVGDPGNAADTRTNSGSFGYGAVDYEYKIGEFEITIGQYATFLNAVARISTVENYWLWKPAMDWNGAISGIARSGDGTELSPYSYSVTGPFGSTPAGASNPSNRPIAYVDWYSAARFVNWLNNGATNGASTETGAYTFTFPSPENVTHSPGSLWWIPTEDEWYKAAYYKGSGTNSGYWLYPTRSDTAPGNTIGGMTNQANYIVGTNPAVAPLAPGTQNYLTDVGAFSNSASAYGTFDQGGNLNEWNEALIVLENGFETRGVRGGSWAEGVNGSGGELSATNRAGDGFGSQYVGFRVASLVQQPVFWGSGASGGGSGTWSSTNSDWASVPGQQGNLSPSTNDVFIFGNTAGTVTVSGSVSASAGLRFRTGGYVLTNGTINMGGASPTANAITADNGIVATIDSTLAGSAGMTKSGGGTLILNAANTYSGSTVVSGGILVVRGSVSNSTVTVSSGGTLGGSGSAGGMLINYGGTISPGNSPGTFNVLSNAVWNPGGNYNWQIYNAAGIKGNTNGWDWLNISGSLDLSALSIGNEFNINLWSLSGISPDTNGSAISFNNAQTNTWTIATAAGGITGFNALNFKLNTSAINGTGGFANALGGGTFSLLQDGNDLNLRFTAAGGEPVPEPGTWAAAALLAGGAALFRWRRRQSQS